MDITYAYSIDRFTKDAAACLRGQTNREQTRGEDPSAGASRAFSRGFVHLKKESSGVSTVGRVIYEPPSPGEWTTERRRDEAKLGCLGKKKTLCVFVCRGQQRGEIGCASEASRI
ncbi:hypothetical protein FVEG_16648 [Fusarium verticillioides 7600]|uniref:Uncharacterized protein n=1 Tax=Gibberella moniliformis (strain M3125 / FGSC 7600) TaxID=334819 RepID=W7MFW0_GIBM7|nr:hypothetical protein FVEG_16648 [Fusarium verticillioides 7600]EWG50533.1 hypothetical protein FVEG_16648 [Fusarium verticillioides 7600]